MKIIDLNIDFIKQLENEYLSKNNRYSIEKELINDMSNDDIILFINELYSEFITLKASLEARILKGMKKCTNLSEMDKYFILLFNQIFYYDGLRTLELEKILKKFDTKVFRNKVKNEGIKTSYIKIDVNDIPITDVIARYINLPNNIRKNVQCPIHRDKTASFHIYKETNSFYCFGCGAGGNAINFIAQIENITNKEAFKLFKSLYFNNNLFK